MKMSHVCRKKTFFFPESLSAEFDMRGVSCTQADHTEDTQRMVCVCVYVWVRACVCIYVCVGVMHNRGAQGNPHSPES